MGAEAAANKERLDISYPVTCGGWGGATVCMPFGPCCWPCLQVRCRLLPPQRRQQRCGAQPRGLQLGSWLGTAPPPAEAPLPLPRRRCPLYPQQRHCGELGGHGAGVGPLLQECAGRGPSAGRLPHHAHRCVCVDMCRACEAGMGVGRGAAGSGGAAPCTLFSACCLCRQCPARSSRWAVLCCLTSHSPCCCPSEPPMNPKANRHRMLEVPWAACWRPFLNCSVPSASLADSASAAQHPCPAP